MLDPTTSESGQPLAHVCSWCVAVGRQVRPAGLVSDGICPDHAAELMASAGLAVTRNSDGVAMPVPAVQTLNFQAAA